MHYKQYNEYSYIQMLIQFLQITSVMISVFTNPGSGGVVYEIERYVK